VPFDPDTAIATESDCAVVILLEAGVTLTVGVVAGEMTVTEPVPDALL
jgi:hypothetical protein